MNNRTNYYKSATFIIGSGNQAFPTGGDPLVPATGNAMGVANGQIALVDAETGLFLTAGDTVADSPKVKLVQGTPNSADISVLNGNSEAYDHKQFVKSPVINGRNSIAFSASVATVGTRSAFLLGDTAGNVGEIVPTDETQYRMNINFDGRRQNKIYSQRALDNLASYWTTPNYTTLGTTSPLDHLVKNFAYQLNLNSAAVDHIPLNYGGRKPFVAFAVRYAITGGSGVVVNTIAAGTPFNFMVRNGVTLQYTPDDAFVATIAEAIANGNLAATSTIEVIDLGTAGAAAGAEGILVVALDENVRAVVEDREPTTKVRLRVSVYNKFNSDPVDLVEVSRAGEANGSGKYWKIEYQKNAQHSVWSEQWVGKTNLLLKAPEYVDEAGTYNAFIIEHFEEEFVGHGFQEYWMHRTIVLVPSTSGVGEANTIGSLNSTLAVWLNSANLESSATAAFV